jgi:hypothetical protein
MTRTRKGKNVLPSQLDLIKDDDSNSRSVSGSSNGARTSSNKRKFESIDNILKKAAPVLELQQHSRQVQVDKASKEKFTSSSMESETPRLAMNKKRRLVLSCK